MAAVKLNEKLDYSYEMGEIDSYINIAKDKTEQRLKGKKFAGMEKDDVVQEVLLKVFRNLEKYDESKAKFSTFVDHIVDNMVIDCYKKCATGKNLAVVNAYEIDDNYNVDDEDNMPSYSVHVGERDPGFLDVEIKMDVKVNLKLSEREKDIFDLRTQGYDFVEIADRLGLTKARISQLWKGIKLKYEMQ